jgi:mannose-6-phosphate isomerase-like protein (cupin superfamily)
MKNESEHQVEIKNDPLDPVAAAPEHHRVLFENQRVRVLETVIGPGEMVPLHSHVWPSVSYYLATGPMVRYDAVGNVDIDSRSTGIEIDPGSVTWLPPTPPHSVENIGDREIRAITVELKD